MIYLDKENREGRPPWRRLLSLLNFIHGSESWLKSVVHVTVSTVMTKKSRGNKNKELSILWNKSSLT